MHNYIPMNIKVCSFPVKCRVSQKKSPLEIVLLFLNVCYYASGNLASKTNKNYVKLKMIQLTTKQRVFVVTTFTLMLSITEIEKGR